MNVNVLKFNKSDLSIINQSYISIKDDGSPKGLAMNPSEDSMNFGEYILGFKIQTTKNVVPNINDEEFCIAAREKIDIAEVHANQSIATKAGEDFGVEKFHQSRPRKPLQENKMFTELKDANG